MTEKDQSITLENKAILKKIMNEAWNKRNFSIFDELISPDYIYHSGLKVLNNREELKRLAKGLSEAFHETKITISELLAEEDRVAVRFIFEGIHKGKLQDLPPAGKKIKVAAVAIVRFSKGKMVECWEEPDNLGTIQQLGLELVPKESVH